jgi:probable rRNA maturation factor
MPATFHDDGLKSRVGAKRPLSAFLETLIRSYRPELKRVRLSYIFMSDEALLKINQDFLQHDTYTDIITFDLSEAENTLEGEIYISVERVAENAEKFKTGYDRELHRVIFHGALHLCGLRDKKKAEQEAMRAAEDAALADWYRQYPPQD